MSGQRIDFSALPEDALVIAARGGDRAAFAALVRRREQWLRALLRRITGDPQLADDVAQEVLLKAWQSLGKLRAPAAFASWLRRLAIHLLIDARRIKRLAIDAGTDGTDVEQEGGDPAAVATAQIDVDRLLGLLSPGERLCIVLHLGEGMSHSEVAQATDLPLGTVKSHIARGTARLSGIVGDAHD